MANENGCVVTYVEEIEIPLPAPAQAQVPIAQRMPQQIALIYGISIAIGGVTPDNNPIIFPGQDANLYLTLFDKTEKFVDQYRLDNLVFNANCEQKYLPVEIYGDIDLDRSLILNPTNIITNTVVLYLWYIPKKNEQMVPGMGQRFSAFRRGPSMAPMPAHQIYTGQLINASTLAVMTQQGLKKYVCSDGGWVKNPNGSGYYCSGKLTIHDV